jgi:hypothetical protein
MSMFASLITLAGLIAAMYAGYRFNMYLYARGALGARPRVLPAAEEGRIIRDRDDASLIEVRDYGLRYARTGILVVAIVLALLLLITVALVSSIF